MKKEVRTLVLPEGSFDAEVLIFDDSDRDNLKSIYKKWRELSSELQDVNARQINLPEGLSESAFCLEMGVARFTGKIAKANTSFDAYDLKTKQRIQIKACSVLPDLTSFGPKTQWDQIYFVDFFRNGEWDGTFDIYLIPNSLIYSQRVNESHTMKDMQNLGKRPRFSIYEKIILENNIKPIKTGKL